MKRRFFALSVLTCMAAQVQAQEGITVYGIVDAGVTYYNKAASGSAKGSAVQLDTGVASGNRLGFRGIEDLGGGLKAQFILENGFLADTGAIAQGGVMFGRLATVGLAGNFGAVNAGLQYDFMADLAPFSIGFRSPAGLSATGLPVATAISKTIDPVTGASILGSSASLSNRVWGERLANSVKYTSPVFGGFSAGVQYAFGEVAGSSAGNRSYSLGSKYNNGDLNLALAYTSVNNALATGANSVWGFGGGYQFGNLALYGEVTRAKTTSAVSVSAPTQATTYEAGLGYNLSAAWTVGGGYQYQTRNRSVKSAQQATLFGDYALSKRTDLYVTLAFGQDDAYAPQTTQVVGLPSNGSVQTALRFGMRHRF